MKACCYIVLLTTTFSFGQTRLEGVHVVDVVGGTVLTNQTIEIADGSIQSIVPATAKGEFAGMYVIPGLIDSHTHIEHSAYGTNYNPSRENLVNLLEHALKGGITTIREMASDVRVVGELARAARLGLIASPDIYYPSIFAGPDFFSDPRSQAIALGKKGGDVSWAKKIDAETDISLAVAAARGNGSYAIKTYALLSEDLMTAISEESQKQGLQVWSHAFVQQTFPKEVIKSGVTSISHAPMLLAEGKGRPDFSAYPEDDAYQQACYSLMVSHRVSLDPTLFVYQGASREYMQKVARTITKKAVDAGVMVVAGTDSISAYRDQPLPFVHNELGLMVEAGLSTLQALQTATINGAINLGLEEEFGSVEVGKRADLVVLKSNPLINIGNTRSIEAVVKRGVIYRRD